MWTWIDTLFKDNKHAAFGESCDFSLPAPLEVWSCLWSWHAALLGKPVRVKHKKLRFPPFKLKVTESRQQLSCTAYFTSWGFSLLCKKRLCFFYLAERELESGRDWLSVLEPHALLLCLELQFRFRRQRGCNQEEVVINFSCLCARACCAHSCRGQIHGQWQVRWACNDNQPASRPETQTWPRSSLYSLTLITCCRFFFIPQHAYLIYTVYSFTMVMDNLYAGKPIQRSDLTF